jgi:flagellar protein FliJ
MKHALPTLIETARTARDRQTTILAQAQLAASQAENTLERLGQFRSDYLGRAPAATRASSDGQTLAQYQLFFSRLDEALALQRQEVERRLARVALQQEQLVRCQQRLLAFEALARRRESERQMREARRQQSETDEFAARVAARAALENFG